MADQEGSGHGLTLTSINRGGSRQPVSACLEVALGLHEVSHDSKRGIQVSLGICRYPWNDGVVGPFARGHTVGMAGVQAEVMATILEREPAAVRDDACRLPVKTCQFGTDPVEL